MDMKGEGENVFGGCTSIFFFFFFNNVIVFEMVKRAEEISF